MDAHDPRAAPAQFPPAVPELHVAARTARSRTCGLGAHAVGCRVDTVRDRDRRAADPALRAPGGLQWRAAVGPLARARARRPARLVLAAGLVRLPPHVARRRILRRSRRAPAP